MTPGRPVAARAILTAFSTASAPELTSIERFSCSPGVSRLSCSQTATYPSYGVIMKQVWVNRSTCSVTAATTSGAALPTLVTAMPEPRSTSELPSTSCRIPPPARSTKTPSAVPMPGGTAAARRAASSRERGPGISVTSRRRCGRLGPPAVVGGGRVCIQLLLPENLVKRTILRSIRRDDPFLQLDPWRFRQWPMSSRSGSRVTR